MEDKSRREIRKKYKNKKGKNIERNMQVYTKKQKKGKLKIKR